MHKKGLLLGLGIALLLGVVIAAQTGTVDALIARIEGLLSSKEGSGATPFQNAMLPDEKTEGQTVGNAFSQGELEMPLAPTAVMTSSIESNLGQKPASLEQGFLLPAKEPAAVGNEFDEGTSE